MKRSPFGFLLGALTGAALATLLFVLFRERPAPYSPYAIAPPEGGETDDGHELFVG